MTKVFQSLRNEPLRAALNLGEKNENLSPGTDVLHNTSNLVISRCCFADDGKEMDKNEKRTCRACKAIVFAHKICKFVTLSLPSPLSLLKLPIVTQAANQKYSSSRLSQSLSGGSPAGQKARGLWVRDWL